MKAFAIEAMIFASLFAVCAGCSVFPRPEPVEKIITVPELYCPVQTVFPRPDPVIAGIPEFMVVKSGDSRLEAAQALICISAGSYEDLADIFADMIIYATETQAALDAWEAQAERTNGRND